MVTDFYDRNLIAERSVIGFLFVDVWVLCEIAKSVDGMLNKSMIMVFIMN